MRGNDYYPLTECCYECASLKTANEDAQAKDFGEAVIYVYKCEAGDEAVCCCMDPNQLYNVLLYYIYVGIKVATKAEI